MSIPGTETQERPKDENLRNPCVVRVEGTQARKVSECDWDQTTWDLIGHRKDFKF